MVTMSVHGPKLTLSNGNKMPQVGLGTWQSTPEEVKAVVKTAIETGYRLIDTAAVYENEDAIGEAIKEMIDAGKVTRDELFITTKVWVTHLHPDDTETSIRKSLTKLKMDYVDLLLAHMPTCFNHDMTEQNKSVTVQDVWRGLESVYNKGLTKAIGVSNWSGEQIERVMKTATVPIHNCQVELHLYWPQHEIHEICKKHNISLTSYATLGSPGRSKFMPDKFGWKDAANDLDDPNVKKLAEKYSKTPAQVVTCDTNIFPQQIERTPTVMKDLSELLTIRHAILTATERLERAVDSCSLIFADEKSILLNPEILLRYAMDRGIAIIPKSVKPARVVENFKLFDFALTSDDIKLLEDNSTKHHQRLFTDDFMMGHPEDPFAAERKK